MADGSIRSALLPALHADIPCLLGEVVQQLGFLTASGRFVAREERPSAKLTLKGRAPDRRYLARARGHGTPDSEDSQ
jgi:hypothetical protein